MKNVIRLSFATILAIASCTFTSCKDKESTKTTEATVTEDSVMTTEPDTSQIDVAPMNDDTSAVKPEKTEMP
ncbi:MAG: hypothetical protein EOO50_14960 [Flavobacterium sp.]|uniref:hypothetical protein n=1 Tax=Flavobacterium sp. TaxID=239 RepID=UPI001200535B|nr:hypothetical protein [Flavobacterium sp.]RZJ65138.1 MAG: hypothetical protein EOO50_14960 [Flavobacterium sp.]